VSDPMLDRESIIEAFRRLGSRLARRGTVADIYVFGGAAMALAYDSRRATRDIDAIFRCLTYVPRSSQTNPCRTARVCFSRTSSPKNPPAAMSTLADMRSQCHVVQYDRLRGRGDAGTRALCGRWRSWLAVEAEA